MGRDGGGGVAGGMSDSVLQKVLLSYFYVAVWIFLSFSVIVYNKYILDPKMYNWPFPISLTMVHMGFCSSLAVALVRVLRVVDLPTSPSMTPQLYTSSIIPIGTLYAMSLWFSNSAYINSFGEAFSCAVILLPLVLALRGSVSSNVAHLRDSAWERVQSACLNAGHLRAVTGSINWQGTCSNLRLRSLSPTVLPLKCYHSRLHLSLQVQ